MDKLVSIIIPIYNASKYLDLTLKSVIHQSYQNIEVICVDDGSSDGSVEIIKQFITRDSRIKLICQKNQYAGIARNNGLKHANGEFIIFLDSDDLFRKNMIRRLCEEQSKSNADVVIFGYRKFKENTLLKKQIKCKYNQCMSPREISKTIFQDVFGVPWNKFIRRSFLTEKNIWFQDTKVNNDEYFSRVVIAEADKISFIEDCFVDYRVLNDSSLQGKHFSNSSCFLNVIRKIHDELVLRDLYCCYGESFEKYAFDFCINALERCSKDKFEELFISSSKIINDLGLYAESNNSYQNNLYNSLRENNITQYLISYTEKLEEESISKSSIQYRIGRCITNLLYKYGIIF